MYRELFGAVSTYWVMVSLGLIAAMLMIRYFSTVFKLTDKAFKLFGLIALASVAAGFLSAYLFQRLYEVIAYGQVDWKHGGITFMGGLLGGLTVFMALSLALAKGTVKNELWNFICLAPIPVTAAHCFGRLGCFFNGCCFGLEGDGFLHFSFYHDGYRYLATQLIEAAFLALLCGALILLVLKFKKYSLTALIYLYAYSVYRFFAEYLRSDDRAQAGPLSPSQWQSLIMLAGAIALTVYIFGFKRIPFNGRQQGDLTKFIYEEEQHQAQHGHQSETQKS